MKNYKIYYKHNGRDRWEIVENAASRDAAIKMLLSMEPALPIESVEIIDVEEYDENREHCKHIAEELDAYVNGEIKRCPNCGEEHRRDWNDVGNKFKCPNCGDVASVDDWEWLSEYDFLADAYDIEYRCTSRRELRSVCIMVACGGPNIYIDTASKDVELYWWNERARYPMSNEAVEAVDAWAEQMWECC